MKSWIFGIVFSAVSLVSVSTATLVLAAGRTYEGSGESAAHCSLWSSERLRWPQTSVGREKQECRRRAVRPTSGVIQCRLRTSYIDKETGERMCLKGSAEGTSSFATLMRRFAISLLWISEVAHSIVY